MLITRQNSARRFSKSGRAMSLAEMSPAKAWLLWHCCVSQSHTPEVHHLDLQSAESSTAAHLVCFGKGAQLCHFGTKHDSALVALFTFKTPFQLWWVDLDWPPGTHQTTLSFPSTGSASLITLLHPPPRKDEEWQLWSVHNHEVLLPCSLPPLQCGVLPIGGSFHEHLQHGSFPLAAVLQELFQCGCFPLSVIPQEWIAPVPRLPMAHRLWQETCCCVSSSSQAAVLPRAYSSAGSPWAVASLRAHPSALPWGLPKATGGYLFHHWLPMGCL